MQLIEWKDDYLIGDMLIDAHHRTFFQMTNDIAQSIEKGTTSVSVEDLIDFLKDYVHMHFSAEERLMATVGFPQIEPHVEVHSAFSKQIEEMDPVNSERGASMTLKELLGVMQSWFLHHILHEDMAYRGYLAEAG